MLLFVYYYRRKKRQTNPCITPLSIRFPRGHHHASGEENTAAIRRSARVAGPVPNGSGLRRRKRKKSELGAEGSGWAWPWPRRLWPTSWNGGASFSEGPLTPRRIYDVIENAIVVAVADVPQELLHRRDRRFSPPP
ncbi:hypothetical protein OsJ_34562 [Oryza sativa Japonica Group]|uniref:Uncharacterized protein n=2 Tax=Oryza sativa subsp. japonica TaxID=39947 RepID=B9G8G7_ORYSJ|nr:hypothetical protein OsJ_34562 [Oryza sativa Japonica Group]KAF2911841.1 hypothetical protein DAI22_11g210600 [Oryza sativa Japonica Group]